jgi:hypothetical protein
MSIYNTPAETRDIEALEKLGYEVLNPNTPEHEAGYQKSRKEFPCHNPMSYFHFEIERCDALAFKALPDGKIPQGVASEIKYAHHCGTPVFEIPMGVERRTLTLEQTREYLRDVGQR